MGWVVTKIVSPSALASALPALARGLGAVGVGVSSLDDSVRAQDFRAWLESGAQGRMAWLGTTLEDRLSPRRRYPWARSALILAFPHERETGEGSVLPAIARYARGKDYHGVLAERLTHFGCHLESLAGRSVRRLAFTDTAPLPERELAERAGLGWIGKHTGLISESAGSWLLLGGLLTDLDLPETGAAPARCGTCTTCLTACPTGALTPYRLDARLCLSYLTIEHRGWIPRRLRPFLTDWLYGCDFCQAACPWNDRAPEPLPELRQREALKALSLAELIALPACRYTALFKGTSMRRATRNGLRRNAAILAGNRRDPACIPALESGLGDPDPVIRGTAAWALGRMGASGPTRAAAAAREQHPRARREMRVSLQRAEA